MSNFTADVDQNEFLAIDGSKVDAIVTVTSAAASSSAGASREAAEIVIVDTSASMDVPRSKLKAAREATCAAIDCIRDEVAFGVIAGNHEAQLVYPERASLTPSSESTRDAAKAAVGRLTAGGGTAIGSWLLLARWLFGSKPGRTCHAILLTDGANEHETPEELDAALSSCEGRFQCDCRGVGTDWVVDELRRVASMLLGSVDIIPDPADMPSDFRSMIGSAMGKVTDSVSLRLWTPRGARVDFVRQVAPTIEDLTDRRTAVNELTADYPTGAWGQESRDYHVRIDVQPREVGAEMLAGRVSLVGGDEVISQGLIKAIWTDDADLSTKMNPRVAHFTGQQEIMQCIQTGLEARKSGDDVAATSKLGRAVQLASESGNDGTMKLLRAVVDVDDAATGTVRLRRQVAEADEMALDTRSTRTIRAHPQR